MMTQPLTIHRITALAALTLLASCASQNAPNDTLDADMVAVQFDNLKAGAVQGWRMDTTNARPDGEHAVWRVLPDEGAPAIPDSVALVDAKGHKGQTFNLLWDPSVSLDDVDLMVTVRADGGEEDRGGGPAWRIAGESDYYAARWNPLEDNVRVYSVKDGERLQLDTAKVVTDPTVWHTIRVRHVGDLITCWFDGKELLHATDTKLPAAGGIGVWTKADATTSFDSFGYKAAGM